ncbi:MAG: HlyC/CorC family transporter [Deltaproteobacteria bacterium]|nr:HlyC/CorC family transporter [Deltaproteobacteria bacterium]MBI2538546.1 HlyC/CorC family transporter [Deltaproteobacteria bacterium]MBI3063179.1 HlyC/CorC family transporter [Deltaproteobacteria bacterium]
MFIEGLWFEVALIFFLIMANGFFAASEIAVIATRKTRIDSLVEKGVRSALAVARLKEDPDRFLATVQIGVTLVGTLASAIGGAAAIEFLKPMIESLPLPLVGRWGESVAILLVVLPIAYLSLVLGELVPKSLALRFSERIAVFVAHPIDLLSRLTAFPVRILTASSNAVLWLFGGKDAGGASFVSEEEVKSLIREGAAKGIFDETEKELIHSVFEFADTPVKAVMVPRTEIHAVDVKTPREEILKSFVESGFSRIPVYEGEMDRVIGILYNKDIFRALQEKGEFRAQDLLHPPFFVPSSLPISQLLKELQRKRSAMAIVVNEFGEVEGLATLEDLLEEIVGEIRDEYDREERGPVERLPDGSMVIQGSAQLKDLKLDYGLPFDESPDYLTLAGFVLAKLRRIPRGGERVEHEGYRLTIVDMEGRRILKVKLEEAKKL